MRNDRLARLAEILLQAVTTRERAASTLGDLRETAATRGEWWFWRNVIATTASLPCRALADDAPGLFKLALRAWLVNLGRSLGVIVIGVFLGITVGLFASRSVNLNPAIQPRTTRFSRLLSIISNCCAAHHAGDNRFPHKWLRLMVDASFRAGNCRI